IHLIRVLQPPSREMSDVKIEIERPHTGAFTNNDIIKGTVALVVTRAISLNWIQVKLEGESTTQLSIPKTNGKKEKEKVIQDVHKILYDSSIVFPPDNIRQVSQAKEFTLAPGNYSYPFQFKIPMNNSCVSRGGITNKIQINKNTLDVMINNGNFNSDFVRHKAQQYYQEFVAGPNGVTQKNPSQSQLPYHITSQLPPSISGMGNFATIKYYVKVTCKRSSIFKVNLRSFEPFTFLPLETDPPSNENEEESYKEVFVRKEVIFKNRIPSIVGVEVPPGAKPQVQRVPSQLAQQILPKKQGFFQRLFSTDSSSNINYSIPQPVPNKQSSTFKYPKITPVDVSFSFEVRFRHPTLLTPSKVAPFKLFLVSPVNPSTYSLSKYGEPEESNGLGVVYLQYIAVNLISTTAVSVVESDSGTSEYHMGTNVQTIPICNNSYPNLKFDLMDGTRNRNSSISSSKGGSGRGVYEVEIPKKLFANCVIPDHVAPSFRTCNIGRSYDLLIKAGFTAEPLQDDGSSTASSKRIKEVELKCSNIKVSSGLLVDNMQQILQRLNESTPPLPDRRYSPHDSIAGDDFTNEIEDNSTLPSYDDVVREEDNQSARRRYQA
ncbi:Arrestin-related trafficking adapter 10, partial [Candida tropicalis]